MSYAEWDACLKAGLDLWAWETGVYPRHFKVRVLAFIGLHNEIEAHVEDEKAMWMERNKK